jgi:large subunit ribosomal protein L19
VRLQAFEGLVVGTKHGNEAGATFTVRKISYGVCIERIFPLFSPMIDKIELLKKGSVRKSKLYFVREKVTKEIKRLTRRSKLVGISTSSDIAETEKRIKAAEDEAKRVEEEGVKKADGEAEANQEESKGVEKKD